MKRIPFSAFRTVPALGEGSAAYGYQIIATDLVVFRALETSAGHQTVHSVDPFRDGSLRLSLGAVVTRPAPHVEALPAGSRERIAEAGMDRLAKVTLARVVLTRAYPAIDAAVSLGLARWRDGDLECSVEAAERIVGAPGTDPVSALKVEARDERGDLYGAAIPAETPEAEQAEAAHRHLVSNGGQPVGTLIIEAREAVAA